MNRSCLLAAVVLLAASGSSVQLQDSRVSFREALQVCGGALGSVSFSLNHARMAAASGVETDESAPDSNAMIAVVFESADGSKAAKVSVDQRTRSVSAKNVEVRRRNAVACIFPD